MKMYLNLVVLVCFLGILLSCETTEPDPNESDKLQKTWQLGVDSYVLHDGLDKTSTYPLMTITFAADGTYSTANAGKLFYANGTWQWNESNAAQILIDGDFPMDVIELTEERLHLQFQLDADHVNVGGRTAAMVGDYEILLND